MGLLFPHNLSPKRRRIAALRLTLRVVVVPVPGTRRPHPSPSTLGRVIGPRPSQRTVEWLLGTPRRWAIDLVVAAPKHAAFVSRLPMLLDDPRIRIEVIRRNRPASACLIEAYRDGVLEAGVARCECVSNARRMRTASQHEGHQDGPSPHRVGSSGLALYTPTRSCAPQVVN